MESFNVTAGKRGKVLSVESWVAVERIPVALH